MQYTLQNETLAVTVSSLGGELMSVKAQDGTEFIWQGDARYWKKRAPHLFPFVGRLTNGSYWLDGKRYQMDTHGFFRWTEMQLVECKQQSCLVLQMQSSEETRKQYPRDWVCRLTHSLEENCLHILFEVENTDSRDMYFGYGGHPGFCVPLGEGCFEEYRLQFAQRAKPIRIGMSESCFVQGADEPFVLDDDFKCALTHTLFNRDAVVLRDMGNRLLLSGEQTVHQVLVQWSEKMRYLGIWHPPGTDAPFVCIEPWTSLPSRQDVEETLEEKADMIRLAPGECYQNEWSVTFR